MNIFRSPLFRTLAAASALAAAALSSGCDVGDTSGTPSDNEGTIYSYAGLYMSASNASGSTTGHGSLVFPAGKQSGETVTWLRLLQYGSSLQGYDNASQTWNGEITVQNAEVASFNLQGRTTAGATVNIAGTMSYASEISTMDAAWIEPTFAGSIFAKATVAPAVTSSPPDKLTIDPTSASLSTNDITQVFTVSGGTSPYSWALSSSSLGSLSSSSGSSVTYTAAHVAGTNTITVKDSSSNSVTATATYTASGPTGLSISPSSLSLNTNVFKGKFTASGGSGSYEWMVANDNLGTLSASTGSSVTYTSKKIAGTNTITVLDDDNGTATAAAIYSY